jgi:hypothetical protein
MTTTFFIKTIVMPKFVIERDIPGVGDLTGEELQEAAQTVCGVLFEMGPRIQWVQTYITDNKMFCIYIAPDEATIREHSKKTGFPADKIYRIRCIVDPITAEEKVQSALI